LERALGGSRCSLANSGHRAKIADAGEGIAMVQAGLAIVDLERWPLHTLDAPAGKAMVARLREAIAQRGYATLEGFVPQATVARLAAEVEGFADCAWPGIDRATPYYGRTDPSLPDPPPGHPRLRTSPRRMAQIAYDQVPAGNGIRALYESSAMPAFLAAVLDTPPLHPMACRYQAVNISVMGAGGCQNWHFDGSEFSTTLMLQKPESGGDFECVPRLRGPGDENYEGVGRVMDGDRSGVVTIPVSAGTLMIFRGERSLHRVSEVAGARRRLLTIFHYDTRPGLTGSLAINQALYGPRVERQDEGRAATVF
jgi:hypothetical protein